MQSQSRPARWKSSQIRWHMCFNMNGAPSEAAKDIDIFLKQLAKAFPDIPVTLEDERFTSVLAHRAMIDGGMKKQDRMKKESVDKISAAIILQSYMDRVK